MKKKYDDWIKVSGAPPAWTVNSLLERLVTAMRRARLLPKESIVLSVSFVDEKTIQNLNWIHRRKRASTDVLSFEQPVSKAHTGKMRFLGDLVLCIPVVRIQANAQKHGVKEEIAVLLTHGLLHLLGYDHEKSSKEAKKMASAEQRVLKHGGFDIESGLIIRNEIKETTL